MMAQDTFELELIEEQAVAHIQAMALRLLDEKHMTRTDLARAMNVSLAHVSQLLGDEPQNLSIKKAARLFYGFGETLSMTCATIERLNREAEDRNAQAAVACRRQVKPRQWQYVSNDHERAPVERAPIAA